MKAPSDMTGDELNVAISVEVMFPDTHLANNIKRGSVKSSPYSTDIAAAWEVVEKMRTDGYGFLLADCPAYVCVFDLDSSVEWRCKADTAPRAICLAALAAVRGRRK